MCIGQEQPDENERQVERRMPQVQISEYMLIPGISINSQSRLNRDDQCQSLTSD